MHAEQRVVFGRHAGQLHGDDRPCMHRYQPRRHVGDPAVPGGRRVLLYRSRDADICREHSVGGNPAALRVPQRSQALPMVHGAGGGIGGHRDLRNRVVPIDGLHDCERRGERIWRGHVPCRGRAHRQPSGGRTQGQRNEYLRCGRQHRLFRRTDYRRVRAHAFRDARPCGVRAANRSLRMCLGGVQPALRCAGLGGFCWKRCVQYAGALGHVRFGDAFSQSARF